MNREALADAEQGRPAADHAAGRLGALGIAALKARAYSRTPGPFLNELSLALDSLVFHQANCNSQRNPRFTDPIQWRC